MIPIGSIIESRYVLQRVVEADDTSCSVEGIARQTYCIVVPRRIGRMAHRERLLIPPRPTESQIWPPEKANEGMASFLASNAFEEDIFPPVGKRPYLRRWALNRVDIAVFLAFAGNEQAVVSFLLSLTKGVGSYPIIDRSAPGGAKHQLFTKGSFVEAPEQTWTEDVLSQLSPNAIEYVASHANLLTLRTAAAATAERLARCA